MLFSVNFFLFQDFYGSHGPWAFKLVLSDFLNLVNLILNILFLHWYLRGHFVDYGVEFVSYQLEENKLQGNSSKILIVLDISAGALGDDPFNLIFPKMTKCSLDMYGPSGSIINYDGLCVLPVNVLNEKIFLIIWTIFIPLLILSVIEQVVWLVFIANPAIRLLSSQNKIINLEAQSKVQSQIQETERNMAYGLLLKYHSLKCSRRKLSKTLLKSFRGLELFSC